MQSPAGKLNYQTQAATWGAHVKCPRCLTRRVATVRTMPVVAGDRARVRYHVCTTCQHRFKSVEELA